MVFGTIILIIGVALLLQTLGILSGNVWSFFWAILFIVVGVKMTMGRNKGKCMCDWFTREEENRKHETRDTEKK